MGCLHPPLLRSTARSAWLDLLLGIDNNQHVEMRLAWQDLGINWRRLLGDAGPLPERLRLKVEKGPVRSRLLRCADGKQCQ